MYCSLNVFINTNDPEAESALWGSINGRSVRAWNVVKVRAHDKLYTVFNNAERYPDTQLTYLK